MAKRKMALYCIPNSRNAGKVMKQLMVMIEQIGPDFDIKIQRSDAQAKSELVDELVEIAETVRRLHERGSLVPDVTAQKAEDLILKAKEAK